MASNNDKFVKKAVSETKKAARKSAKKHPLIWILVIIALIVALYFLTPTENPLKSALVFDSVSEELAIPAYTKDDIIVQHTGYTLSYSEEHEQPFWVAYLLTADEVFASEASREDNFMEDPSIPTGSATLEDYRGSGYDRGHLCPAADQAWSEKAMFDSFYLSNMSPQTHAFNAGIWLDLESAVRTMAAQNSEICVVTGPVLTDGPYDTIGSNKVSVPNAYYKVILDYYGDEHKAIGFVLHQDDKGSLKTFAVSVDYVEALTNIDFFPALDDAEEKILEAQCEPEIWDLSEFNRSKTARKYGYDLNNATYTENSTVSDRQPENLWEKVQYFLYVNLSQYKIKVNSFIDDFTRGYRDGETAGQDA